MLCWNMAFKAIVLDESTTLSMANKPLYKRDMRFRKCDHFTT